MDVKPLIEKALQARHNAYAPYSGLRVGACVCAASGRTYSGCNVENAAFPLGSCAEANAIGAAVLAEGAALTLVDVAISARDADGRAVTIPPCGGCRQRIGEFGPRARVHFATEEGGVRTLALDELLPESFRLEP